MPRKDAHGSEFSLVRGLRLDWMAYGSSATNFPPDTRQPNPEYTQQLNEVRAAIRRSRGSMTARQRLVFLLRYEVEPRWTQLDVAKSLCATQQTVSWHERRMLGAIKREILCGKGVVVRGTARTNCE